MRSKAQVRKQPRQTFVTGKVSPVRGQSTHVPMGQLHLNPVRS
jgi:hypothetical protein